MGKSKVDSSSVVNLIARFRFSFRAKVGKRCFIPILYFLSLQHNGKRGREVG
jgi:hypothetical protein